jgi:nucleoside-diphosphate-sugar epimerase
MKIGILGGRGFIGSNVVRNLSIEHSFFIVKPEVRGSLNQLLEFKPDVIINACSSLPNASEVDSRVANFDYPLNVFNFMSENMSSPFTWIQIASYYELEFPHERTDSYTKYKYEFRTLLQSLCFSKDRKFRTLFLPHVIGKGERSNRLINSAIISIRNNLDFELQHPQVKLPILIIDDVVIGINKFLIGNQTIACATPIWYKSNGELILEIKHFLEKVEDITEFQSNESTEIRNLIFPPKIEGWEPTISLREYVLSFRQ